MSIFQTGNFTLHSGEETTWKIECDRLDNGDWKTITEMIRGRFLFGEVHGVPGGGIYLASLLRPYCVEGVKNSLIVDDVYTTGNSMRAFRNQLALRYVGFSLEDNTLNGADLRYQGVVVFARAPIAPGDTWITPIFQYW